MLFILQDSSTQRTNQDLGVAAYSLPSEFTATLHQHALQIKNLEYFLKVQLGKIHW